jgi:transcriptional regulator with XRE-family HTH domain
MKRRKEIVLPNLADIPFAQALEFARALSGLTYEEIAERMGKGQETVRRYFTDPTYNPPAPLIPKLCGVLGNTILVEWQSVHAGGYFTAGDFPCEESIETQIARLTKEFSDVLHEDGQARLDGEYSDEELSRIQGQLTELLQVGNKISSRISSMRRDS